MLLKDKVVIITGGGRGIGKGAALKFAAEGAAVALVARTQAQIDEVAKQIEAAGGRATALAADVSDPAQVQTMAARVLDSYGRIDILVNNAGVFGLQRVLADLPLDDWDMVLNVNLRGTMLCAKAVLPSMIAKRSGCIINVSSLSGRTAEWGRTHYCASKWGVIGFTQALAHETGRHNIRVNCVVPGLVYTEFVEESMRNTASRKGISHEEIYQRFAASHPLQKIASVDEVADLMVYLASDRASAIHGQSISVNAGYWMT